MKKVRLTGGICSGKTIVGKVFGELGIPVFEADKVSKDILHHDQSIRQAIRQRYGNGVFDGKTLMNKELARIVFSDEAELSFINGLLHPKVHEAFDKWTSYYRDYPYVMEEAAILIESGAWKKMNAIILVKAPEELRIQRIINRDHVDRAKVMTRMSHQLSDEEKEKHSDYAIINDEQFMVVPQVLNIHQQLI